PPGRPEPRARRLTRPWGVVGEIVPTTPRDHGQVLVRVPLATGPVLPRKVNFSVPSDSVSLTSPCGQPCLLPPPPWFSVSVPAPAAATLSWPAQENEPLV